MSPTQRELAEEESSIWEAEPSERRMKMPTVYWKHHAPERNTSDVESRRSIRDTVDAQVLWDAIDKGMPLKVAGNIAIAARRKKCTAQEVMYAAKELADKKQIPFYRAVTEFKGIEFKKDEKRPSELEDGWRKLREDAAYVARRMLSGEDSDQVNVHITGFMVEVEAAVARFRARLRTEGDAAVTRIAVIRACRLLAVPIPRKGEVADEALFRKQAQRLRVANHADRMGAAYDNERYITIGRALEALEAYNAAIKKETNGHTG
jgi:hypothetical protein